MVLVVPSFAQAAIHLFGRRKVRLPCPPSYEVIPGNGYSISFTIDAGTGKRGSRVFVKFNCPTRSQFDVLKLRLMKNGVLDRRPDRSQNLVKGGRTYVMLKEGEYEFFLEVVPSTE